MAKNTAKQKIGILATGVIIISVAPLACNGKICTPISEQDLPASGGFSYDFYDNSRVQVSGLSATITAFPNI